jgi:protein gp37
MADQTKIEWADMTFNPWMGCTKVSPACDNCYAAEMMDSRYGRVKWGSGEPRVRTAPANWRKPLKWDRDAAKAGTRPFVFCASLADVFDNEVPPEWRADLFRLIEATPNLVWLLLTKRIGNVVKMVHEAGGMLPNIAFGATMANQAEYDRDAEKLARTKVVWNTPPLFTFGSFEPLLSNINLWSAPAPDWIIVGGESGGSARPMNLTWARNLRADAAALGRTFNFKQVGGRGSDKGGHALDGVTYFDRPTVASAPQEPWRDVREGE